MSASKIDISDTDIRIMDLIVPSRDVAGYIGKLSEDERETAVIRAVEVGVFCLERVQAGHDLDFIRRQLETLVNDVQRAVDKIPNETQERLTAKIGTGEGQVLAPVRSRLARGAPRIMSDIRWTRAWHVWDYCPQCGKLTAHRAEPIGARKPIPETGAKIQSICSICTVCGYRRTKNDWK
jgi:hypothetical protein